MNSTDSPTTRLPPTARRGLQITGVATITILGGMRLLYEEYYRTLGVELDEVGLSSWRMLTYPLAAAAAMSAFLAVAVYVGVVIGRLTRNGPVGLGAGTASYLAFAALFERLPPSWSAAAAIVVGGLALRLAFDPPSVADRRRTLAICQQAFLWTAGGLAAFAWVAALAGASATAAELDATGGDGDSFAAAVLDVRALPVCAKPLDPDSVIHLPQRPLLLLGSADGRTVLWDPRRRRPLRVPTAAVHLLTPQRETCR